jgi:hypothetical protein
MAKHCKAKTKSGQPCRMKPIGGGDYCFTHSPGTRRAQAEARKKGGQARHTPHFADPVILPAKVETLPDAHQILTYTLAEVAGMDNSIGRARVLLALFDSFVKSFEIGELEQRIAALEARTK